MTELMMSGIELMVVGMGIVYLFLIVLVFAIYLMSSLVQRFFPEAPPAALSVPTISTHDDKSTIAAIAAAVHQYRKTHNL